LALETGLWYAKSVLSIIVGLSNPLKNRLNWIELGVENGKMILSFSLKNQSIVPPVGISLSEEMDILSPSTKIFTLLGCKYYFS